MNRIFSVAARMGTPKSGETPYEVNIMLYSSSFGTRPTQEQYPISVGRELREQSSKLGKEFPFEL